MLLLATQPDASAVHPDGIPNTVLPVSNPSVKTICPIAVKHHRNNINERDSSFLISKMV